MSGAATETVAFRMELKPGAEAEYRRRHDALWPELREALLTAGVLDYRIFLDPPSGALFATMRRRADHAVDGLAQLPAMRRWWAMMADIMATEPDQSPLTRGLTPMFVLEAEPS